MKSLGMVSSSGWGKTSRFCSLVVVTACLAIALFSGPAPAEIDLWPDKTGTMPGSLLPTSGRTSLLDPSKLNISHQMVFSYSSGQAGTSNVGGLWLTNFSYKLSNPLTVDVAVGAALSKMGTRELDAKNLFLEGFSLRYTPNENFYFHFVYREMPGSLFLRPEYPFR